MVIFNCASFAQASAASICATLFRMNKDGKFAVEDRHHRFPAPIGFEIGRGILLRLPIGTRDVEGIADRFQILVDVFLLIFDRLRARADCD